MTTTKAEMKDGKVRRVCRTYSDPKGLWSNELRYFVHLRTGQHVVVREFHDDSPAYVRYFDTVEDARAEWARLRGVLAAQGYTRLVR